ncbi:MAG: HEAT repeat domain-containing protein [Methylomonas sp.]
MKAIKPLLGTTLFAAAVYLAYQNNVHQLIFDAYQQLSGADDAEPASEPRQQLQPVLSKPEIDLLIQQQYQKAASQMPDEDELSDSEKLQMLDEALHELDTAEDEYDREVAVMTLGELQGAEAKQGIITALHDESDLVVSQAIRQIDKWQEPTERTEMLLTALQSQNDDMVEQTLLSISQVDDKKLIARLKQLSKHLNPNIREAAQLALNLAP